MKEYIITLKHPITNIPISFKCLAENESNAKIYARKIYPRLEITSVETSEELKEYIVTLKEDKGDKVTLFFRCMADDPDHAEEQALDMYPNAEIISATYNWGL